MTEVVAAERRMPANWWDARQRRGGYLSSRTLTRYERGVEFSHTLTAKTLESIRFQLVGLASRRLRMEEGKEIESNPFDSIISLRSDQNSYDEKRVDNQWQQSTNRKRERLTSEKSSPGTLPPVKTCVIIGIGSWVLLSRDRTTDR
jgi:hypothetical protein